MRAGTKIVRQRPGNGRLAGRRFVCARGIDAHQRARLSGSASERKKRAQMDSIRQSEGEKRERKRAREKFHIPARLRVRYY